MLFGIILILLVLLVAYFHYMQGFFSSAISGVLAAVSLLVAFTYYEPLIAIIKPGKFADSAHSMVLVALFAITYILLRVIFDKLVNGNVRLPSTLDKVGGAVVGLVIGVWVAGLIAVAAQAMPFGPSIAGYSRYRILEMSQVDMLINESQHADRKVYNELAGYSISTNADDKEVPHESLTLPVDDMLLGFIYHTSDGGSTAGGQAFARIHPDYLQELFGNRIGIEVGAKRSAQPFGNDDVVAVQGVYSVDSIPQTDAEPASLRKRTEEDKLPKVLKADGTHALLVVRLQFKLDATDPDKLTRVSPGSVRLVVPVASESGKAAYRQYFPVGTVDGGHQLMVNKPDDFLFLNPDKSADFLFVLDASALPDPTSIPGNSEMFVEAKRYGRVPLAGQKIEPLKASDQVEVLRKSIVMTSLANSNPDVLKKRLIGSWDAKANDTSVVFAFNADGTWSGDLTVGGQPVKYAGKWIVVATAPSSITIESHESNGPAKKLLVTFSDPNNATMTDLTTKVVTTMVRKS